jgi:hypothetical protein
MSFHPELLVNHLVKDFLPQVNIVRLTIEKEVGKRNRYLEKEIRYVEIIDKYEKLEEIGNNYFESVVNIFYHYLFTKSQVTVKGLKLFQYLINNRKNMITENKKKVYYTKMTVEEHNKIEWIKNIDLPNFEMVIIEVRGDAEIHRIKTIDIDFKKWTNKLEYPMIDYPLIWFQEYFFN